MSTHDDDTCPHLVRANLMEAQNARLKAEVERLTDEHGKALADFWNIHAGYFRLEAEVNRLTAFTTRTIIPNEELQAQVERLTKAGDELWEFAKLADTNAHKARRKALKDWNAAKGVQS